MPKHDSLNVVPIIGLEVHVQLAARTKMWCACPSEFGLDENSATCPVCLGLPGALPVLNQEAVRYAVLTGLALNCRIAERSLWQRKHYFYPDQPKNYQITQYSNPLCTDGYMELKSDHKIHKIRIERAHLEEDAGKILHHPPRHALIDLNRSGAPLLEIVTEPDFRSADETREFAVQLQRLARYLGVSEANMEKGQMRFEPNVNLKINVDGREVRTPIVEIKNLNSFHSLHAAINFEIDRQLEEWRQSGREHAPGQKINRGWDESRRVTVEQREKEEPDDYRYMPEPDLPPLILDARWIAEQRDRLPELPIPRIERCVSEYKLNPNEAAVLVECRATADLLDQAAEAGADKIILAKQFLGFWVKLALKRRTTVAGLGIPPVRLAELANLVADASINSLAAEKIAAAMADHADKIIAERSADEDAPEEAAACEHGEPNLHYRPAYDKCIISFEPAESPELSPRKLAQDLDLLQSADREEIMKWIDQAVDQNPDAARQAAGDAPKAEAARTWLTGQIMKASKGKAPPNLTVQLLQEKLKSLAPPD